MHLVQDRPGLATQRLSSRGPVPAAFTQLSRPTQAVIPDKRAKRARSGIHGGAERQAEPTGSRRRRLRDDRLRPGARSEEHTSELQSLMRISYAVFCLKKKKKKTYSTR